MKMLTHPTDQRGFTLVELLAVLAIISLAIAAFAPAGGRSLETTKFRAFLMKTTAMLKEGRSLAISQQKDQFFRINAARREFGLDGGAVPASLPSGVDLKATLAERTGGILFHPQGTSSGGVLAFTFRGQVFELRVNWLTGHVSQHRI